MRPRLDSLTSLRAVAALAVFTFHVPGPGGAADRVFTRLTDQGLIGVSFFFALSGFVLVWAWRDGDRPSRFYRRRFARIYPAMAVALLLGLAVNAQLGRTFTPLQIALPFLGLQSWVPSSPYVHAADGVAWSLSCETFFYLLFPFLVGPLIAMRLRSRRLLQAALLAAVLLVAVAAAAAGPGDEVAVLLSNNFPLARLPEFVLGATVAVDVLQDSFPPVRLLPALLLAGAAYLVAGSVALAFRSAAVTIVPLLLVLGAAARSDLQGRRTPLTGRALIWGGEISYCFYLVHELVLYELHDRGIGTAGALTLGLALAVAAATVLHYAVERPFERRLRGSHSVVVDAAATRRPLSVRAS